MQELATIFGSWPQFLIAAAIMIVAEAVYVSFGFGAGLIAVGSLAVVLPEIRDVVVLLLLVNIPVELVVSWRSRRDISWRGVLVVAIGAVLGAPIGSRVLKVAEPTVILTLLGAFLVAAGLGFLALPQGYRLSRIKHLAPLAGLSSGCLAGLFGTGGPPLIIYYQLSGVSKAQFRGNLIAIFLLLTCVRVPNYLLEGLLTLPRLVSSLVILPAVALGAFIGHRVHLELSESAFRRLVSVVLALIGLKLLLRG